jgi:hypothetical protein
MSSSCDPLRSVGGYLGVRCGRGALSVNAPIGLALWILSLHGMTQTSATLSLLLLVQVVPIRSSVVRSGSTSASTSFARNACLYVRR